MAKQAITDNSLNILNYLKEHDGENLTAVDIAEAIGSEARKVNGTLTGLQKRGYTVRIPATVECEDANGKVITKQVKFIELTDDGRAYDHDAATEADAAEAAAKKSAKAAE